MVSEIRVVERQRPSESTEGRREESRLPLPELPHGPAARRTVAGLSRGREAEAV